MTQRTGRLGHALALLAVATALGCSGTLVRVAPRPPEDATVLGPTRGSGCGVLLFDVIPVGVNGRVERAYAEALRARGGTALVDTTVTDRWYTVIVGTLHCTDVAGVAVR
jgi:hypothetical protein